MADVMKLNVITPEKQFYEGDVTMVELTTTEGDRKSTRLNSSHL